MTNSQREFEDWMNNPCDAFYAPNDIFNFSSDKKWLLAAWQACNALWERKLAAIPSLSFDEAVEKIIASGNFAGTGLMIKAALKALTANGDVLIRRESTSESLAQSAKEQDE